ncbi:MAG: hypothetical protein NT062_19025 [Proteobacteria bacterium]|nr:hypothetical protein [Pseudomonadota bacterium]
MRTLKKLGFAFTVLMALALPARADKTFNIGSLILPPGSAYQTDCGAVAVYGLVYDVLRANAWLAAHPASAPGGAIEIYYSAKDTKASPNRCAPTNTSVSPTVDAKWIDGCDFEIYNNAAPRAVSLVNNTATAIGSDTDIVTNDTIDEALGANPQIYPGYATQTIKLSNGINTVRYLGAPFVIDDVDAPTFLALVQGTLIAQDSQGNNISFAPFRTNKGVCTFGTDVGGYVNIHRSNTVFTAPAPKSFSGAPPRVALLATTTNGVSSHDIQYDTYSIEKNSNNGAKSSGTTATIITKSNHGLVPGDKVMISGVGTSGYNGGPFTVLTASGKTFTYTTPGSNIGTSGSGTVTTSKPGASKTGNIITIVTVDAHGLAVGDTVTVANVSVAGYNANWTVKTVPNSTTITIDTGVATALATSYSSGDVTKFVAGTTKAISDGILQVYLRDAGLEFTGAGGCPPGGVNAGNIAKCPIGGLRGQIYDTFDFADITAGKLTVADYKMVWTPHWETTSTSSTNLTASEQTMINNIATFLESQTGLMAECQSIASFEGAFKDGAAATRNTVNGQFQTCVNSSGACSGTVTQFGMSKISGSSSTPTQDNFYPNCSDPNRVNGDKCIYFGDPGDPFAQAADYSWRNESGLVQNFLPNTAQSVIYRPGVETLISGVNSLDKTKLATNALARTMITADYATRSNKGNDTAKGNIVYVAGHNVNNVVSGTKVILQTLLLLGEPPIVSTTLEVTRSSPITSVINNVPSIIQGSFVKITPPPTTPSMDTDAQAAGFSYPDVIGHLRAINATGVTTTQTSLGSLSTVFDAADALPPTTNSYSGCGSSAYGANSGGCRTIFTHTASGFNPPRVLMDASAVGNAALKTAINLGGGSINTNFATFLQRIIAGIEYPAASGTFVAKLGGVDRSTVAVVPTSLVAGVARPKIIYFGGTDGMLHAVCGSTQVGTGCSALGRELWGFIPRLQLPYLRKNTAKIDGSPRVIDLYGDFTNSGSKSFRTILMFQTGNGDPATAGKMPSVTALDITDPFNPQIVWEYALGNAAARGTYELGQGLVLSAGPVRIGALNKNYIFAHTNNGGSGGVGNVVTSLDAETGLPTWQHGYTFPVSGVGRAGGAPPITAIPGGAVYIDKSGTGTISDVIFGTIYGDVWQLDAATGVSRHGVTKPLFRHTQDQHPFGASPTIYSQSGALYVIAVTGGYADLAATTLWSSGTQIAVSLSLTTPPANASLTEASGAPYLPWKINLGSGEKGFGQAIVVGDQVFITTDTDDVNTNGALGYGVANADTGHVYQVGLSNGAVASNTTVRGGAGSIQTSGSTVYSISKDKAQRLSVKTNGGGESPASVSSAKVARLLWLRTL